MEGVKELYFENYKILMKEIEEDINSGKVYYVCGSKNQYCQNDFSSVQSLSRVRLLATL